MKYKARNVGSPANDLGDVLRGQKLRTHLRNRVEIGKALYAALAPRGSQRRPHVPMALRTTASTEMKGDRLIGVLTADAPYAIASEYGNRQRPRGDHTLRRVATLLGDTKPARRGR